MSERHLMRAAALSALVAGALSLGAPVVAQDGEAGGLRPVDEGAAPVQDLGGWLEEGSAEGGPAAGSGGADPLAPEGEVVGAEEERLSPEEQRKRDRQITKNYQAALDIYDDLNQPHHDMTALDRRIANNERIVREYGQKIGGATEARRQLQVELYNRSFYLKQQLERGQIDQSTFDRLVRDEEQRYRERSEQLKRDLAGWHQEVDQARARLDNLRAERRVLEASLPRTMRGKKGGKKEPEVSPAQRLMGTLQERLRRLQAYDARTPLDSVHPRDVGVSTVGQRPRPAAEAAPLDEE